MEADNKQAKDKPVLFFEHREAWGLWLEENHRESAGLWLQLAKKTAGLASVNYADALEVALCYGWIDGQKQAHNEQFWLQKFTPRGARSPWSRINREKVLLLIERGEMRAAGLRDIERAQADGRWHAAYDSPGTATVPADFQLALEANPQALAFFATLKSSQRYAMLFRIQTVKKAETRARKIQQFTEMLARGETA